MKTCSKCLEDKPKTDFSPVGIARHPDRLRSWCKKCNAKQSSKWHKDLRKNNPEKNMFIQIRSRAKKKGLAFNLTMEDFIFHKVCPVLGGRLAIKATGYRSQKITMDRIDNSKGYIKGNVALISWRANKLKSDASLKEIRAILHYMESHLTPEMKAEVTSGGTDADAGC